MTSNNCPQHDSIGKALNTAKEGEIVKVELLSNKYEDRKGIECTCRKKWTDLK